MKRDLDLIRKILIKIEEAPTGACDYEIQIDGYDQPVVNEHLILLVEANLIKANAIVFMDGTKQVLVNDLTWAGHDFISVSQKDSVWKIAKEKVIAPGASFTFDLLKEWLRAESAKYLGSL
ncbi:DUF2513 domain-containing protein [Chromobacterium vaccinii]|uniref:DUF2513 domain-containing protein n=1 Tax=Chromobacterium vaccinii TaxID=1108595 RepID=UPI0031D1C3D8